MNIEQLGVLSRESAEHAVEDIRRVLPSLNEVQREILFERFDITWMEGFQRGAQQFRTQLEAILLRFPQLKPLGTGPLEPEVTRRD